MFCLTHLFYRKSFGFYSERSDKGISKSFPLVHILTVVDTIGDLSLNSNIDIAQFYSSGFD